MSWLISSSPVLSLIGEFQIHPERKKSLKPVFLGGKRNLVRNNKLSYKTGLIWNSPLNCLPPLELDYKTDISIIAG